jgi:hypothetical protein
MVEVRDLTEFNVPSSRSSMTLPNGQPNEIPTKWSNHEFRSKSFKIELLGLLVRV